MHPTDLYSTHGLDTYKVAPSGYIFSKKKRAASRDTGRHYFLVINGENFSEYLKDPLRVTRPEFWHKIIRNKEQR